MTQGRMVDYIEEGKNPALFRHVGDIDSYQGRQHKQEVICGGHRAASCAQCTDPKKGEGFCHGDCTWIGDACVLLHQPSTPPPETEVTCGNHKAANCAGCPQGNG